MREALLSFMSLFPLKMMCNDSPLIRATLRCLSLYITTLNTTNNNTSGTVIPTMILTLAATKDDKGLIYLISREVYQTKQKSEWIGIKSHIIHFCLGMVHQKWQKGDCCFVNFCLESIITNNLLRLTPHNRRNAKKSPQSTALVILRKTVCH